MNQKFCVALVALAIVMFATSSFAGLVMNLTAMPGPGYSVSPDGKQVIVPPGVPTPILMQVWCSLSGTNGVFTDDKMQTIAGGVKQTQVQPSGSHLELTDTVTKGYLAPFDFGSSSAVNVAPLLLGTDGATASTGSLVYRSASAVTNTSLETHYALGTVQMIAMPQPGTNGVFSTVNWAKAGAYLGGATFVIDNSPKNGNATSGYPLISVGDPVQVAAIPEPSTIILLGMGALALVFIRRRK
ncbi:MAG: PEP-CTERM sorting domain-containing protein [Pirellulales bacterium]|nr:PEP-CTERM sorting domain-containing protein [Pirellulales bacterium]